MNLAPTIQREVGSIDPDLPVYRVRTMTEVMGDSLQRRRLALILLAVFAGLALLLAGVGIYGVTSYGVAQGQREIALRMAPGADRGQVLRMMIRRGMGTIAVRLALGVILALSLTRLMTGLLFAVRASDPLALGGAALLLTAAARHHYSRSQSSEVRSHGRFAKRMRKSFLGIDWGDSTQL
jgi:putative ABC transport system permease protein